MCLELRWQWKRNNKGRICKWLKWKWINLLTPNQHTLCRRRINRGWCSLNHRRGTFYINKNMISALKIERHGLNVVRRIWDISKNLLHKKKKKNKLSEIEDDKGNKATNIRNIQQLWVKHSENFYKERDKTEIQNQLNFVGYYPFFFSKEEDRKVACPISLKEVHKVLFFFSKDKCTGPNGWTIESFIHFFDITGKNLLEMME